MFIVLSVLERVNYYMVHMMINRAVLYICIQ